MKSAIDTEALKGLGLDLSSRKSKPQGNLEQQDFLKLLTTQIQNQDPFKPMENGEFLSQMAQFGTVSGINELKDSFSAFAGSMQASQGLQAANLVGRDVLVPGDSLTYSGQAVSGAVELPSAAAQVNVSVYDAAGQLVRRIPLGAQSEGVAHYQWDGKADNGDDAAPGTYLIEVDARINQENIALENFIAAKVNSVTIGKLPGELQLSLAGVGERRFSEVREIA